MSPCDEVQVRLSAYLDGEAGDQGEAIRAHVATCDACRSIFEGFRRVSRRVRDLAEEQPTMLVEGILRRVRQEAPRRRGGTPIPKLAAAAAIAAAVLWGMVLLGNGGDRTIRLSDLAGSGELSKHEQQILFSAPPSDDELISIILRGGAR